MIDMKLTPVEKKKEMEVCGSVLNVPQYPWSLRLRLDCDQVEKLGCTDLDVGKKIKMTCMVEVVEKEKREVVEGQPNIAICLQICEMDLEKEKKSDKDVLYKG